MFVCKCLCVYVSMCQYVCMSLSMGLHGGHLYTALGLRRHTFRFYLGGTNRVYGDKGLRLEGSSRGFGDAF